MNRKTPLVATLLMWSAAAPLRADDVADARKAFDLYVQYSGRADQRMVDLFARDVAVVNARFYGKEEQDVVIAPERFFQILQDAIDSKSPDHSKYEDIRCVAENGLVKLSCTMIDSGTGDREPTVLVYEKDKAGQMKIKAMKTVYPPLNPSPAP